MTGNEPSVCFVTTDDQTPSSVWLSYAAEGLGAKTCTFYELENGVNAGCDAYVIERETWRVPRHIFREARVLCWLDDAYHLVPFVSHNYRFWRNQHDEFLAGLRRCAGLIAPNPYLAADYSESVRESFFIPNYHNFPRYKRLAKRHDLMGWGGSWNHWISWRDTRAHEALPKKARFEVIGHQPVYEMVKAHHKNTAFSDALSMERYLERISSWSLYLIPVAGEYDRRRSWIKALEAAYAGTRWQAVGNAAEIYRNCEQTVAWAEAQRITHHLDEWQEALFGC